MGEKKHTQSVYVTFLQCSIRLCNKQCLRALDSNAATPSTQTRSLHQSVSFNSCNINALIYSPHLKREGEMSTIVRHLFILPSVPPPPSLF